MPIHHGSPVLPPKTPSLGAPYLSAPPPPAPALSRPLDECHPALAALLACCGLTSCDLWLLFLLGLEWKP